MKSTLLALMTIMFSIACLGQQFEVEKLYNDPSDLTAVTAPRPDLNSNGCALLKVQIPMSNVSFEGNIVGNVEYKSGEYWVYLSNGTKEIGIKHDSYMPARIYFAEFGIHELISKKTYILQVFPHNISNVNEDSKSIQLQFDDFYKGISNMSILDNFVDGNNIVPIPFSEWISGAISIRIYPNKREKLGVLIKTDSLTFFTPIIQETYGTYWEKSLEENDKLPIDVVAQNMYNHRDSLNMIFKAIEGKSNLLGVDFIGVDEFFVRRKSVYGYPSEMTEFGIHEVAAKRKAKIRYAEILYPKYIYYKGIKIQNHSLWCESGGRYYSFTRDEWHNMSSSDRKKYTKHGLVFFTQKNAYVLNLKDESVTLNSWNDIQIPENYELPDHAQIIHILSNLNTINNALECFGGKKFNQPYYWGAKISNERVWIYRPRYYTHYLQGKYGGKYYYLRYVRPLESF